MIRKLSKHGDGWALVIDRSILELLKIDEHTELEISTHGRGVVIQPVGNADRETRSQTSVGNNKSAI